jgi:hypothetical protein
MSFRAQCSNCLRVTTDPEAKACPNCGERRLVVLERGDAPTPRCRDAERRIRGREADPFRALDQVLLKLRHGPA